MMLKVKKRFLTATTLLVIGAFLVLVLRLGFPSHRVLAIGLYVLSWVTFLLSFRGKTELVRRHQQKVRTLRLHAVVGVVLLAFAYTAQVLVPVEHTELLEYSDSALAQLIDQDLKQIDYLAQAERPPLTEEHWPQLRGHLIELDRLAFRYKGFYQIDFLEKPVLHASAFLAGYSALQARARIGFDLVGQVTSGEMEVRLNEARPEWDIPDQSYFQMKRRLTHQNEWLRLHAGRAYLDMVEKHLGQEAHRVEALRTGYKALATQLAKSTDLMVENPLEELERRAFKTWFPVQKGIALGMSQVRAWDDPAHITPKVLAGVLPKLQPGDILLERRSGYMTNLGIPGFWSHAAIYIGTPEEFAAVHGQAALDRIEQTHPEAAMVWRTSDELGYPHRVIEAKRPGVIFTSLEDSAACDNLAVLRADLDASQKAAVVGHALEHHGKPYDFNFDFASDGELVCSELVYKAFTASGPFPIPLKTLNGRSMLPPHELAEYTVYGKTGYLSLVLFVERGAEGEVGEVSSNAFKRSLKRPSWYGFQAR